MHLCSISFRRVVPGLTREKHPALAFTSSHLASGVTHCGSRMEKELRYCVKIKILELVGEFWKERNNETIKLLKTNVGNKVKQK